MRDHSKDNNNCKTNNGFLPNSLKFISSCIKTASSGVRSAGASVAASISGDSQENKDQVLWACFDRLELGLLSSRHVLLLGYSNGFQVLDVEDASNISELVSKRDDPVSFLQMQPYPAKYEGNEGFRAAHPLLLVVACDKLKNTGVIQNGRDGLVRDGFMESQSENLVISPTSVRFYSLRSHNYVHALRFRSTVYMVRCSRQIVAVGLAAQIYCFDALTLENKFSVLTYPVPQLGIQGIVGVNIGYGPMAVGPRWLAYASNNQLLSNTGRLSPQSLTPPGVSPSTSPGSSNLVARYAMESSKHLAAGLINLGDMGYKKLSRYYQELVPDGSGSPVSSHSSWKVSRLSSHSTETDMPGVVVVKDFVTRAVISQFRAHTSPISALCFDPSGTLLVTASVHGNNINVFRIMPSCSRNGTGSQSHDWSSSHVHLYKLHRGMTSAVIQDICFSQYSQWIAIISSKGTCHVFVLAPFGGETVLQIENSDTDGPILLPVLPMPWWFTPNVSVNQHSFSMTPPPPVTLSVASRIKNCNSGLLNTVSNAASFAAGKASIPSGAVASVFHSSIPHDLHPTHLKAHALENLLVFAPSGHLIQYKLLPSVGAEPSEIAQRRGLGSPGHMQDDVLRVKVEPVQWWDVGRRNDWPEIEECVSGITFSRVEAAQMIKDTSDYGGDDVRNNEFVQPQDRSHFYFSNAEVQINSGRIPIWQKPEMSFFAVNLLEVDKQSISEDSASGEIEIEKVPTLEVEIRRKDLLPVFEHFHRIQSDWGDRGLIMGRCSSSSSDSHGTEEKSEDSKLVASGSVEKGECGFLSSPIDLPVNKKRGLVMLSPHFNQNPVNRTSVSLHKQFSLSSSPVENGDIPGSPSTPTGALKFVDRAMSQLKISNKDRAGKVLNSSYNHSDLSMNILDDETVHDSPDFEQFFQEGYCKASADCRESTKVVTDVECGSPCNREKSEEDGESDDMLGGVFDFSEEG